METKLCVLRNAVVQQLRFMESPNGLYYRGINVDGAWRTLRRETGRD